MAQGKLLLIPNVLEEGQDLAFLIPEAAQEAIKSVQGLIVESERNARRYLRRFVSHERLQEIPLRVLSEHTKKHEIKDLLAPIRKGEVWGLISDAGIPCVADPGADLVSLAHRQKVHVETFVGPSSIMMALQLSGFSGQHFTFHGYLPRERVRLEPRVLEIEKKADRYTQIWIEAPYRSQKCFECLKETLDPKTELCVAASLTFSNQRVLSQPIENWKKSFFSLEKEPVIFLIRKQK